MGEAITGASVVVKLPVCERAWSVSDVMTRVSMVALELLRTTSGGSRQRDGINAQDTKVTSGVPGWGFGVFNPPAPEIPKAHQNRAKLNPICENC